MPRAEKHEIAATRKINRETHSPYNQSGRKVKKTSSGSWSPSIWNMLTFWKSADAPREEDEEDEEDEYYSDLSIDHDETSISINHNNTIPAVDEDGDHNMSPLNISNLSEEQVIASLTRSPRHVHFQLPNGDQEQLASSRSTTETSARRGRNKAYVAPLPPSSPLNQSGPSQDPLAKVSEYLDNVVRPRGGECTDVEALGLSILIQSSVNQSGTQHATPSNLNPFLLPKMNPGSASVSPSPSPVRPMFTNRSTDIDAVLASSSSASGSRTSTSTPPSTFSPGRTLTRNPNGSLYYQGGGSARSRYHSPAFGSPGPKKVSFPRHFGEGKSDSSPMNGVTQSPSPSDGKRRRVGEERDSSVARASGSHPAAPNGISTPLHATVTSTPAVRFGTSAPASRFLASTPARPSPLRQSIRADSISPASSSAGSANGGSSRSRPSRSDGEGRSRASEKASEIMAGIINDATPKDSVPDVRNPYQPSSQSPTKRSRKAPARVPRPLPRPTRQSNGTPSSTQPKKLSALEIIQRTAPQAQVIQTGSKRSHTGMSPPKSLAPVNGKVNSTAPIQTGSNAVEPVVIELDEDEDELRGPPPKKHKSERSQPSTEEKNTEADSKSQTNVDLEDVDMEATNSGNVSRHSEVIELDNGTESQEVQRQQQQETKRPVSTGPLMKGAGTTRFQSTPKEPSPLRQSFQPDMPPSPPEMSTSAWKTSSLTSTSPFPLVPTSSSSPFAQTFAPSPASAPAPSPSASTSTPPPFTSTPPPSPFASTFAPSPFAQTSASSGFASTSSPFTFTQTAASSALTTAAAPLPFGSMSTSPKSAPSPFTLAISPAKDDSSPSPDAPIPVLANPAIPVPSTSTPFNPPHASADKNTDLVALAKKQVLEVPVSSLPTFAFAFTTNTSFLSEYAAQRDVTLAVPTTELPKFDFVGKPVPALVTAPALAPKMEVKTFNWDAVGMSRPTPTGWTCGLCSCRNPEGSSKCSVCDEIKP